MGKDKDLEAIKSGNGLGKSSTSSTGHTSGLKTDHRTQTSGLRIDHFTRQGGDGKSKP